MNPMGLVQIVFYLVLLILLAIPLGSFMARVFQGKRTMLDILARPLERLVYRLAGVDADQEMNWRQYTVALLAFNFLGMALLFLLQLLQGVLPFNPQGFGALKPDLAFNTAASFMTNTNWQAYATWASRRS